MGADMGKKQWDAVIEVDFGGLSLGDSTGRLGFKVERARMDLEKADQLFSGKRCSVLIENKVPDPAAVQLPGMDGADVLTIEALVDIKSFGTNAKVFTTGLTFNLESIDARELAQFPKRRGKISIKHKEDLPDASDDPE
jgi:hypothetical protein